MMRNFSTRKTFVVMLVVLAMMVTAACTGGNGDDGGDQTDSTEEVQMVVTPWSSTKPSTHVVKNVLENRFDRTVTTQQMNEGLAFQALANDDLQIWTDSWLPFSFGSQWEEYGDQINDVTVVYEDAPLGWIVPDYVEEPASATGLEGNAEMFDRTGDGVGDIYGLESGQDMNQRTQEMIDMYDINYEVHASSESAMIAELENAIEAEEPIITMGWSPHWIFGAYDIHFLEDPDEIFQRDNVHILASQPFSEDNPQALAFLEQVSISLEDMNAMINEIERNDREPSEVAQEWIDDNEETVSEWVDAAENQ